MHALPSPNRILLPAPHPLTCPLAGLLPSHLPCRPPTPSHGLQCGSFPVDGLEVKQHAPGDEISRQVTSRAHITSKRHTPRITGITGSCGAVRAGNITLPRPWLTGSAPSPMHQQRTVLLSWVLPAWAGTSHRPPLSCHHLSQQAVPPSSCPPLYPRTPRRRSDHGRASCKRDGGQGSGRPDRFPNFGFSILEHLDRFSHSAMIHRLKDHPYARKKQTCDAEGAVGRVPRTLRQKQQLPTCPGLREASIARCRQLSGLCLAGRGRAGFAQGPDV